MKSEAVRHTLSTFGIACQGLSFPAIQFKALDVDPSYSIWLFNLPLKEQVRRMVAERERLDASRQQQ